MKTKFKFASLFALLLTLLSFAPKNVNAQCPTIHNSVNCPVTVQVDIYEIDPNNNTCTQWCNSYVIPNIAFNQIVPINCGPCQTCNVEINILAIGGTSASGFADFGVFPPNPASVFGGASGCITTNASIYYLTTGNRFRINP